MTTEIDRARSAQTSLDRRGGKPIDTAHTSTFLDVRCMSWDVSPLRGVQKRVCVHADILVNSQKELLLVHSDR